MTFLQLLFYFFATIAIVSSLVVISSRNPVYSVLALVLTFFATAGIWLSLNAEFLALILVLVYVGAVMTLFLFVVMMLNISWETIRSSFVKHLPIGIITLILFVGLIVIAVRPEQLNFYNQPAAKALDYSNTADLGSVLYTEYAYPFEIAAVMLLTAIVAAISLTHRTRKRSKSQVIAKQIEVKRSDRVRLIKMPSEKRRPL